MKYIMMIMHDDKLGEFHPFIDNLIQQSFNNHSASVIPFDNHLIICHKVIPFSFFPTCSSSWLRHLKGKQPLPYSPPHAVLHSFVHSFFLANSLLQGQLHSMRKTFCNIYLYYKLIYFLLMTALKDRSLCMQYSH